MDPRTAIDLPIDVNGERVRSESLQASLSPYVLAIGTTLPDVGVSLYSTYHGHPGAQTVAVHLSRRPHCEPLTLVRRHDEKMLPVVFARARCLRDHAVRLQDLLRDDTREVAIHLSDGAEFIVEAGRSQMAT